MNTLLLLAVAALALGGSASASTSNTSTKPPPPPPPTDNTQRDINTGFNIAKGLIDIATDLLDRKSGPVTTTI